MPTKQPSVSVCVPIYNAARFLSECLDSLVNQTLKNIEIICVDDGSTDDSPKVLDRYAKKYQNIRIIHQENQGLGGARNAGMKMAHGKYVGFIDADDYVEPTMYETLYLLAEKNDCDIAMCNLKFVPAIPTKKHLWYKPYKGKITGEFLDRNIQPWNKIVSRKLIVESKFEFFPKNGDDMFIILMLKSNGIVSTDKKLYCYRIGNETMSTSFKVESFINFINCTKSQTKELMQTKYKNELRVYFDYRMIYVLIQAIAVSALRRDRKLFEKCKKELNNLNYKKNPYMRLLLKNEFSKLEYMGMVHVLPVNYWISSILMSVKLRNWR